MIRRRSFPDFSLTLTSVAVFTLLFTGCQKEPKQPPSQPNRLLGFLGTWELDKQKLFEQFPDPDSQRENTDSKTDTDFTKLKNSLIRTTITASRFTIRFSPDGQAALNAVGEHQIRLSGTWRIQDDNAENLKGDEFEVEVVFEDANPQMLTVKLIDHDHILLEKPDLNWLEKITHDGFLPLLRTMEP